MDAVTASVGGSTLLIETVPGPVPIPGSTDEYGTQLTSRKDLRDAYTQLKELIRDLGDDLAQSLINARPDGPAEVTLEIGLAFSGGANVWVLTSSAEVACKVSMTWKRPERDGHV